MFIFMFLIPILVIWVIIALTRGDAWFGNSRHADHTESAMELLKRRYARGDIGKEEFEEKKRALDA
ncbi:MAG: SHOCT domain-containing protein [Dehalococcoidia bacterium]|nr:SHOCT domain-containing protein [Dehalococcoidia bacterium]